MASQRETFAERRQRLSRLLEDMESRKGTSVSHEHPMSPNARKKQSARLKAEILAIDKAFADAPS